VYLSVCLCVCLYVCPADSMESASSKQFVTVDDVALMNGDSNVGMHAAILFSLLFV